ncbi:hypothetical protein Tco_1464327 [Tanacetum coccineum]
MSSPEVFLKNNLIPVEEIKRSTQNFNSEIEHEYRVFRGQVSECWQNRKAFILSRTMIAIIPVANCKDIIPWANPFISCKRGRVARILSISEFLLRSSRALPITLILLQGSNSVSTEESYLNAGKTAQLASNGTTKKSTSLKSLR